MAQRLEVTIDSLAAGGDGVARAPDGRVLFVPFTAPGDRVLVRVHGERRRYARARVEALVSPAPSRTDPLCPVFGSCGGCTWQHLAYPAQLEAKAAILRDALVRIGGVALPGPIEIVPSPSPYGYGGRARGRVEGGRVGYRRRRSHALCPVRRCPVLTSALDERLAELADAPPTLEGEWELVGGEGAVRAAPVEASGSSPSPPGPALAIPAAGDLLDLSPGVFAQSNALLLDALCARVVEAAGRGRVGLELFAGAGFFTLGLARAFERLVALEASEVAVRDLRANLRRAGCDNVGIVAQRFERAVVLGSLDGLGPQTVVLDPPRTGLSGGSAPALAALGAERIVYLSCDPATLARDVAALVAGGYRLASVGAFDLFPQTSHVEALAILERGEGRPG